MEGASQDGVGVEESPGAERCGSLGSGSPGPSPSLALIQPPVIYSLNQYHYHARRSNQSILKEINPEYSLEGLMLKLKLQYLGHLMRRTDSLEKTLMLGKTEGGRRRG